MTTNQVAEAIETPPAALAMEAPAARRRGLLRRLLSERSAVVGICILVFLFAVALFADVIAPYPPNLTLINVEPGVQTRAAPCIHILGCAASQPEHFFGLDGNARDEFSRVVYGARTSLFVGFITVSIAIVIGTAVGAAAGFFGGRTDNGLMRVMDILLAFPALLLALVIVTTLEQVTVIGRLEKAMIAVSFVSIPIYARVTRSSVITVREQDYVTASKALGASQMHILRHRVMPNAITPLIVQATLGIGTAVLEVAALSFLGLAAQPPLAEWGTMIGQERNQIFSSPWLIVAPGVALTLVVLGFNLLGDGLRDALDPRLSK